MNMRWFALILMLALIPGCSGEIIETTPSEALYETKPTEAVGLSFCDVPDTGGAVQSIPLEIPDINSFRFAGDAVVTFSGYPDTILTVWNADDLSVKAEAVLPLSLTGEDSDLAVGAEGLTYVDDGSREVVFLDPMLKEAGRIPMPEDCTSAVLSSDSQHLYYCTAAALRVLDLPSGADRPVREMAFSCQEVTGIHCDGAVLQCRVTDRDGIGRTLFISSENGLLLYESSEDVPLWTRGDLYFSIHMDGAYRELLSGSADFGPSLLVTDPESERVFPILEHRSAVLCTQVSGNRTGLDIYHLETGTRIAHTVLPSRYAVMQIQPDLLSDALWLLCQDPDSGFALLRWDLHRSDPHDSHCYLQSRWTAGNPDAEGLAACREMTEELARKHGVQILLWTDAVDIEMQDCSLAAEYQVPLISGMLQQLDETLSRYPEGFLEELAQSGRSRKLNICLVRSIDRTDGSATDKTGLLHWDNAGNVYLVLTPVQDIGEQTHLLLSDLIASRVLGLSDAYDGWDRSSGHPERVQLLAAAMQESQAAVFSSGFMQSQLRQLCLGIRETFSSAKAADTLPWEQHLKS